MARRGRGGSHQHRPYENRAGAIPNGTATVITKELAAANLPDPDWVRHLAGPPGPRLVNRPATQFSHHDTILTSRTSLTSHAEQFAWR
jgi:hypothetical protein